MRIVLHQRRPFEPFDPSPPQPFLTRRGDRRAGGRRNVDAALQLVLDPRSLGNRLALASERLDVGFALAIAVGDDPRRFGLALGGRSFALAYRGHHLSPEGGRCTAPGLSGI
jgi:hypothetical protein